MRGGGVDAILGRQFPDDQRSGPARVVEFETGTDILTAAATGRPAMRRRGEVHLCRPSRRRLVVAEFASLDAISQGMSVNDAPCLE